MDLLLGFALFVESGDGVPGICVAVPCEGVGSERDSGGEGGAAGVVEEGDADGVAAGVGAVAPDVPALPVAPVPDPVPPEPPVPCASATEIASVSAADDAS